MTRKKRGIDDEPDTTRPPNFPVKTGPIIFGQVYPCTRCDAKGTVRVDKKDKPCPRCEGTGWHKRQELPDGQG